MNGRLIDGVAGRCVEKEARPRHDGHVVGECFFFVFFSFLISFFVVFGVSRKSAAGNGQRCRFCRDGRSIQFHSLIPLERDWRLASLLFGGQQMFFTGFYRVLLGFT